jgi:hypothetical protein
LPKRSRVESINIVLKYSKYFGNNPTVDASHEEITEKLKRK